MLEAGFGEHGAEPGDLRLDPEQGIHDRLGVAQGIRGELPVVLAHAHFHELTVDLASHCLAIGRSNCPFLSGDRSRAGTQRGVRMQNLGEVPWVHTGYLR